MNKFLKIFSLSLVLFFIGAIQAMANERPNLIWARTTSDSIIVDGKLDEAAWAKAETMHWRYGENTDLIPGSGWHQEQGIAPSDPADVTVRFLVYKNYLYMAAEVQDSSIGGGLFNKFDGFLMNLRDHASANRPAPATECFYGWVTESWAEPSTGAVGAGPSFIGGSKDSSKWVAATVVDGITNSDTLVDKGYTTEIQFKLSTFGYNVAQAGGDIVEFNMSVYDADWQWPLDTLKFSGNRCWWEGPWGNASSFDLVRIYARPDVTTESGDVPEIGPEMTIQNGANYDDPVIDGKLDDPVWANVTGFDLRYGDDDLRNSYSGIGPYRSGQYQPPINNVTAAILDPADATIKTFFKGNMLYLGAEVRDKSIWGIDALDQWDGVRFIINDRVQRLAADHNLDSRMLTARVDSMGQLQVLDYLKTLVDSSKATAAMTVNGTVNDYSDVDQGFTIEIAVDLTDFGYEDGLGDGVLFYSATVFDGEKVDENPDNDYGDRVWFYRESGSAAAPVWAYMDPNEMVPTGLADEPTGVKMKFEILGNYPNPFNPTTKIAYTLPGSGNLKLNIYNVLGQMVYSKVFGEQTAGYKVVEFNGSRLSSGVYFYNLEYHSAGKTEITHSRKMLLIK